MVRRYGLRDDQWNKIKDLLPGREGYVGGTAKNNRLFIEAVLYRYRAGIAWRDLPKRFGDFRVIHTRHMRWSKSGVWQRVFEHLTADADNEYATIDSTIVKAHQQSAGAKNSDKKRVHLTPGQAHDLKGADVLLPNIIEQIQSVLADKTYYAKARILDLPDKAKVQFVIPPKKNRKEQLEYYKRSTNGGI